jgi:hypothetical protein
MSVTKIPREQLSSPVREPAYADQAAMIADQANQETGWIYYYGASFWKYKGTTDGVIGDYAAFGGGEDSYNEATILESNTVPFDKDYIIGNAEARTGNILASFTGAKLGATFRMRHNSASGFTMPTSFKVIGGEYKASVDNYIWGVLTEKTVSSEKVEVTIGQVI